MDTIESPFNGPVERYLVHRILIIDSDENEVNLLTGILAKLKGETESRIDNASVDSLQKAKAYITTHDPYIIIIDPVIDNVLTVLKFVQSLRRSRPNIIWVINTKERWWQTHAAVLAAHPFGSRIKNYYRRSKTRVAEDAKRSFVVALALCQNDFAVHLLKEQTEEIQSELGKSMSPAQVSKFLQSALRPLLSLINKEAPPNSKRKERKDAFVSMSFAGKQMAQYNEVIAPRLKGLGYNPIMMEDEYGGSEVASAVFANIGFAALVIVDLTDLRPNVMIEAGAARMAKRPIVYLACRKSVDDSELPFMLRGVKIEFYSSNAELGKKLEKAVIITMRNSALARL